MSYTTIISTEELAGKLTDPQWAIIDARFSLANTEQGRQAYQEAHIPGAVYAHLDEDLSGPIIPGKTSRHPLPDITSFTQTLSQCGIDPETQVVVYDDMGGAIASRLWWMLRWLGHDAVAVLDGGWPKWKKEDRPTKGGIETRSAATFIPSPRLQLLADANDVEAIHQDPNFCLIDSRGAERYRGEQEPIDPVAGHIPGAINAPFAANIAEDGTLLPPEALRQRFADILGDHPPQQTIFYCGSGVTAAHNLLALAHAGFDDARMYAGSWSEWITDTNRPIAIGAEPG